MRALWILLVILLLCCAPACSQTTEKPYVAMLVTPDLNYLLYLNNCKYVEKFDYLQPLTTWEDLPSHLEAIARRAGNRPILMDYYVHGTDTGLYVNFNTKSYRATFGYVLNETTRAFAGKRFSLLFESCHAGKAYRNTVRGGSYIGVYDQLGDYVTVPDFPIWAAGADIDTVGAIMWLQWHYSFRKYWTNIVDYDQQGKNRPLGEADPPIRIDQSIVYSRKSYNMKEIWDFFTREIP